VNVCVCVFVFVCVCVHIGEACMRGTRTPSVTLALSLNSCILLIYIGEACMPGPPTQPVTLALSLKTSVRPAKAYVLHNDNGGVYVPREDLYMV
jgi:hypothetical protein